jgi:hypothetical protein
MDAHKSSGNEAETSDEDAKESNEPANSEASRQAKIAAEATEDELRNARQTKGEQSSSGLGCVPKDRD